jgi:hypothetical protein
MSKTDRKKEKTERRNVLSSIFVVILIGLAYQEMVTPVRESVRANGITLGTSIIFFIFFMTSMRFFIGNQLHLMSDGLLKLKGRVWFYDLLCIILQTTILVFLGGVSSVQASRSAKIGFVGLLIVLYSADVLWILSQWLLGIVFKKGWRRDFIPWGWFILNIILVACMLMLYFTGRDLYSDTLLIWLGILNGVAFIVDVILVDYYDVL